MNNIKSMDKDIINETDSDLVNILLFGSSNTNTTLIPKYLVFQLILFSRQKGSPVNYIENWTMSITQIYEVILNYFFFKFRFSYLFIFCLLFFIFSLPCYRYRQGLVLSAVF